MTTLQSDTQVIDLGDRVVDVSLTHYCRTTLDDGNPFYVNCTVKGMFPTNVYNGDIEVACMIDAQVVDTIPTGTTEAGASTYQGKSTIKLSAYGDGTFKFAMPSGVPVGARQVKVVLGDRSRGVVVYGDIPRYGA